MTNRELLKLPDNLLNELDRQRRYLLRVDGQPMPCPACKTQVNVFDAAGIDPNAYDFGITRYDYRCSSCGARLEHIVPFLPTGGHLWHWELQESWLQDRLQKARAFEELQPRAEQSDAACDS